MNLRVHQIELELQNEQLQAARSEAEATLARYTDIYDFAPVGYFTLQRFGEITQTNLAGARLLGVERALLTGKRFGRFVAEADLPAFNTFLLQVFVGELPQTGQQNCEIELMRAN